MCSVSRTLTYSPVETPKRFQDLIFHSTHFILEESYMFNFDAFHLLFLVILSYPLLESWFVCDLHICYQVSDRAVRSRLARNILCVI